MVVGFAIGSTTNMSEFLTVQITVPFPDAPGGTVVVPTTDQRLL